MSAIFPNFGKVAEIRNAFPNSEAFTNSKISRANYRSAIWLRNCDLSLFWYFFYICFLTMLNFLFKGSLIIISKVNFCRSYLMMAIFKYEECTQNLHYWIWPGINIKSIQENEFLVRCFGSLIGCCSLNWEVVSTIFGPSNDILSISHQRLDLTLKSTRRTKAVTRFRLKFLRNVSKSSWDELGERCEIKK